jgi:hypothetical protein
MGMLMSWLVAAANDRRYISDILYFRFSGQIPCIGLTTSARLLRG